MPSLPIHSTTPQTQKNLSSRNRKRKFKKPVSFRRKENEENAVSFIPSRVYRQSPTPRRPNTHSGRLFPRPNIAFYAGVSGRTIIQQT